MLFEQVNIWVIEISIRMYNTERILHVRTLSFVMTDVMILFISGPVMEKFDLNCYFPKLVNILYFIILS